MTRAEAIELARNAVDGAPEPWRDGDDEGWWYARVIVDALLEAGMTFGEEAVQIGTADLLDKLISADDDWVHLPPRMLLPHAVVVHRPQGESKP